MIIAICDDDESDIHALKKELTRIIQEKSEACEIHTYTDVEQFLKELRKITYDGVFLDIDMPHMSGLEAAAYLGKYSPDTGLVFVSSCDNMVFEAIKAAPLRFIRKTRLKEELEEAVVALLKRCHNMKDYHDFCVNGSLVRLKVVDIRYFESVKHYVMVRTNEEELMVRGKMADMEQLFADKGFVRVQSGYIVNLRYVDRVRYKDVLMDNGECITISRDRLEDIKRKHLEFIRQENNL